MVAARAAYTLQQAQLTAQSTRIFHVNNSNFEECSRGNCGPLAAYRNASLKEVTNGLTTTWLVGPYTSTGGFDWWDTDFDIETPHATVASFAFSFHAGLPPAADEPPGKMLGLPPLHNHHVTCVSQQESDDAALPSELRLQGDSTCGRGLGLPDDAHTVFECQKRDLASHGYTLLLSSRRLRCSGLFNDVRAADSEAMVRARGDRSRAARQSLCPLPRQHRAHARPSDPRWQVWYFNTTITFVPPSVVEARALTPLTMLTVKHSSRSDTVFFTSDVPQHEDSFMIFPGAWEWSGSMIGDPMLARHHAHVNKFQSSYLIAATPAELGLEEPRFMAATPCGSVATRTAGFSSNDEMLAYLVSRCPRCYSPTAVDTRLFCRANASTAQVDGLLYDRMANVRCAADTMPFRAGDNFTVISFLGPQRYGEFYPQPLDADMTARDVYPMHSNWWLYFIGEDADTWNRTAVNRQTVLLTHSSVHTDLNNTCIIP